MKLAPKFELIGIVDLTSNCYNKGKNWGAKRPNFSLYVTTLNITLHYFTILHLQIQLSSKYFTVYKIRPKINFYKFLKLTKNDTFGKVEEIQQKFW